MSKRIYSGYNFIYEQMANDQKPAPTEGVDPVVIITQLYSYLNSLLIVYDVKGTETTQSFDELTGEFQNAKSLDEIRKAFMNLVGKTTFPDDTSKKASNDYFVNVFDTLMKVPDINGKFGDIQKKLLELLSASKSAIAKAQQVKAVAESLLEKGHGYLEDTKNANTGTETDTDGDDTPSNKWYVELANHVMDMATAFKSETTAPLLDPAVAADSQAQSIIPKAQECYTKALDLQILGKRKSWIIKGKINTKGGLMKGRDFRIACENLMDEIKRDRDSLNKIKSALTKIPAPPPIVVTKTNAPAAAPKTNAPAPANNTQGQVTCDYPIAISLHVCDQVKELQAHLMEIPCIKDQLAKHGGADGKYGKFTSMISNVVYSVITKNDKFSSSVLTQEMHDGIMKFSTTKNENINSLLANKVFEKEHEKKAETLRFEDFSEVFDSNKKLVEQETKTISDLDLICKKVADKMKNMPGPVIGGGGAGSAKPGATGGAAPATPPTNIGADESIKRFKPMKDGNYGIPYDDSVLTVLSKSAFMTAMVANPLWPLTIIGGEILGRSIFGKFNRKGVPVTVQGGYIKKEVCDGMVLGLIHTLDGFVSREDILALMQTLCTVKGCFTLVDGKPKSVWAYLKENYQAKENEDLVKGMSDWGTNTLFKDISKFPDFHQRSKPGTDVAPEEAKSKIADAVTSIEKNEGDFAKYLGTIPKASIDKIGQEPEDEMEGGETKPTVQATKKDEKEEN